MAQIKAAFFDIDGTLLPFHAKALPESTVQALAALRKNGVKTFIATGRPPVHLPYLHALDGIPFDGYVTMLEYAGIGVAMGNACDAARAAADYVTDDITARRPCKGTDAFWADLNKLSPPKGRRPAGAAYMRPAAVRQMTSCGKAAGRACPAPTAIYKASP